MATTYGLTLVTAPTEEPLSLAEAKKQVEIAESFTAHDGQLQELIQAAREYAEDRTGRQIVTATWDLFLDRFPCSLDPIAIPKPPLQSVVITYVDAAGDTQTWSSSNYTVSTSREPGLVRLAYGQSYPTPRMQPDAVKVRFVAGYGAASACPAKLKGAMKMLVGAWFDFRNGMVTGAAVSQVEHTVNDILEQMRVGDEFIQYGRAAVYA